MCVDREVTKQIRDGSHFFLRSSMCVSFIPLDVGHADTILVILAQLSAQLSLLASTFAERRALKTDSGLVGH